RAVAVDGGEQDFSRAHGDAVARPFDGVKGGSLAAAANTHLPVVAVAFGVNSQHDGLRAEFGGKFAEEFRALDGGGVDGDFISGGADDGACLFERANAAACGQGNGELFSGATNGFKKGRAVVARGGDVEDHEFVCTFRVVTRGEFPRIAGIAKAFKMDAFDDA